MAKVSEHTYGNYNVFKQWVATEGCYLWYCTARNRSGGAGPFNTVDEVYRYIDSIKITGGSR